MLMRLNLLWKRFEMTILPPPGGPMAPNRNMDYKCMCDESGYMYIYT